MKKPNPITPQNYRKMGLPGSILLAALVCLVAQMVSAQTVAVRSFPVRITVADSGTYFNTVSNYVNLSGTTGAVETLTVSGMPGGDTAIITGTNGNANTVSFGTILNNTAANIPDGIYPLDLNATGTAATTDFILLLQSGRMWTGSTNLSTAWSSSSSWVGGNPPGASSDVLFTGLGAQTNFLVSTNPFYNSIVDQNFTVASLRFSQNTNGSSFHSLYINPGVTLNVTGANGLSLLQDALPATTLTTTFAGQGGTLNVNNTSANISILAAPYSSFGLLDMSRLGTFTANINRFTMGDFSTYPNVTNLIAEGNTLPNTLQSKVQLAMTNFITAFYVDPNNYTNSETNRFYALEIGNNPSSAPSSSSAQPFFMGITNAINVDGICVAGFGGTTAALGFNPATYIQTNINYGISTNYVTNSTQVAVFRNTDGVSRMSIFTIGDLASAITNNQGNTKGNVDFGSYGASVNMLVDRFYMARDRTNCLNIANGDDAQTTFGMGRGILNANTVVIGDQESGDQPCQGFVYGTMTISNNAVLVANNSIQLGYETADYADLSLPGVSHGILNINTGGTVLANTIGIGGPSGNSGKVGNVGPSGGSAAANTISMSGGNLIVSNVIGSASALATNWPTTYQSTYIPGMLGVLNMVNSSLTLFVNGNHSGPYVNTCQLTFTGSTSNTLVIASISNLTVPSVGSTNIPLLWIQDASPNASAASAAFTSVVVPSGYQGALVLDATNNQILDLNLSQHIPNHLEWQGYANSTWDTTTFNWLDMVTGLHTNFANGDFTTFDDTAATATNITISGTVQLIPNNVTVTNNTAYYRFSGSSLVGGSTLTKSGTGYLEFDSTMTLGTVLNGGTLVGNGTIGGVNEAAGATLNYIGNINGGVTIAGLGLGNGTINGLVTIATGGVFTNFNVVNGTFNAQSNSFVFNAQGATFTYGLGNTGSIATNAIFVNDGNLNGDAINDSGTFEDLSTGGSSIYLNYLSVLPGGVFYPGSDALGNTTINPSQILLDTYGFPGALLLSQGSTLVLNVNNPNITTVTPIFMSFGGSSAAQTENGATLKINNLGPAFTAGQVFNFFVGPPVNTGSSSNTFPVISPTTPGPGLAWNLKRLWYDGSIGVVNASSGVPPLTNSITVQGTNIVLQFSWNTNDIVPGQGYRLETQNNPLTIGISNNWGGVSGSWTNSSELFTNTVGTNNAVFYRLVYP